MEQKIQAQAFRYPPWLQQAISIILGASVIYLTGAYVNDLVTDARRDERIKQLESSLAEFRKPGKRYSKTDGDRDRKAVQELKREFYAFKDKGSRASLQISRLVTRLDNCDVAVQKNSEMLLDCRVRQSKFRSDHYYIMKALDIDMSAEK